MAEVCKSILEAEFDVVAIVDDGLELLRSATELQPDVIVLDIALPSLNGLDAGKQLRNILPKAGLVYLTMNTDPNVATEAFRRGASAYLLKSTAARELAIAVREASRGRSYVSPAISKA